MTMLIGTEPKLMRIIARWKALCDSEQADSQRFVLELCDALDVAGPDSKPLVCEDDANSLDRSVLDPCGDNTCDHNLVSALSRR